jgi:hypothetical protein
LHEQRKLAVNTRPTSPPESLVMLQAFSRMLPDTVEVWRNHDALRIARDGSDCILAREEHFGRDIVSLAYDRCGAANTSAPDAMLFRNPPAGPASALTMEPGTPRLGC